MAYLHSHIQTTQSPKRPGDPCGDVVFIERDEAWTTLALVDGIGSGIRGNLAAIMAGTRLMELLRRGMSLREAFARLVQTMNRSRDVTLSFSAFCVARIRHDGHATILCHEMPPPILIQPPSATVLDQYTFTLDRAILSEATCRLGPGEGLFFMSDGITQAGLGCGMGEGWGSDGVAHHVRDLLQTGASLDDLDAAVHRRAVEYWGPNAGDDCTATLLTARDGVCANLISGPPAERERDEAMVDEFFAADGVKLVCGGSTAAMVARHLDQTLSVPTPKSAIIAPPSYRLAGVDLVTEGTVTLNQVCNILDVNPGEYSEDSGVTDLASLLQAVDRVNLFAGTAVNPATGDLCYRQQGIRPRKAILSVLIDKLRAMGKLVTIQYY